MDQDAVKRRMRERLQRLKWSLKDVQRETGDSYRSVQNWVTGDTRVPADFVARFVKAVPVSSRWLLLGEGRPDPREEGVGERFYSAVDALTRSTLPAPVKRGLLREFEVALKVAEHGPDGSDPGSPEG